MDWISFAIWLAVLPAWLAFDWFFKPGVRRAFGGGVRFLLAIGVQYAPAWLAVFIIMVPAPPPAHFSSMLWRLPLAIGVAALSTWIIRRAPGTASLYRDYQAAVLEARGREV